MSQINQRTQKLLVLAGDEGPSLESRDFKRVVQVIVNTYLNNPKPAYEQFLVKMLPTVIRRIPLKQHIYAGLTAQIRRVNQPLSLDLFKAVVANLQKDLNSLKIHESINSILYLSQLMNLEKLNSQCFYDLIDDIVTYLQNCKNSNHKLFFVLLFSRTLNNFCLSLNKRVNFQFKKLLQRAKKYCSKNVEFTVLYDAHQKGTLNDGSIISRLGQQTGNHTQDQIQQNIKLKIVISEEQRFQSIQYQLPSISQSDKLYQQYVKNEGPLHTTNLQQIIQLMKQNSQYVVLKTLNYINGEAEKSSFIQRYSIDVIFGKALRSSSTAVESTLLLKLIKSDKSFAQIVLAVLHKSISIDCLNYDYECIIKFAEVLTFIATNWPAGGNQMTDIAYWDWDKIIQDSESKTTTQQESKESKISPLKKVLLKTICLKLILLNENFKYPVCLKKYAAPQKFQSPAKYRVVQQMEKLETFQQLLKDKSSADEIIKNINSEGDYQIFLEALFEKTSQSHTHLEVLMARYEKVFMKQKQDFDWSLLNGIRSYWANSLFHRLLYLETVIERGYVDFESYVKNIAKVETANEEESLWIKLELNELHNKFGAKLDK